MWSQWSLSELKYECYSVLPEICLSLLVFLLCLTYIYPLICVESPVCALLSSSRIQHLLCLFLMLLIFLSLLSCEMPIHCRHPVNTKKMHHLITSARTLFSSSFRKICGINWSHYVTKTCVLGCKKGTESHAYLLREKKKIGQKCDANLETCYTQVSVHSFSLWDPSPSLISKNASR